MNNEQNCETCMVSPMSFAWTDTHGVGQCTVCGTPYEIYHYDEQKQRVSGPPTSIVAEKFKPLLRQYWQEFKRIIPSGCSFPGGQELATPDDARHFYTWLQSAKERTV